MDSSSSSQPPHSPETPRRPVDIEIVEVPRRPPSPYRDEQFYEMPPRYLLAAALYVLTCLSTFLAGALMSGQVLPRDGSWYGDGQLLFDWGFKYSFGLMSILTFHELGHYFQARRYKVPASLPYFIPLPLVQIFGTLGAVIVQRAGWRSRKILFDIAVTGPLAGLVVAIPIVYLGLLNSSYVEFAPGPDSIRFGDPLILKLMAYYLLGPQPAGTEIMLTPLLFAGWVGLFVTALNLIPMGQLDGGHILYALLGKRAHYVAIALTLLAVGLMAYFQYYVYMLMLVLVVMMGVKHPPTGNDREPLGAMRIVIGWLSLAFLIFGFTPTPIVF